MVLTFHYKTSLGRRSFRDQGPEGFSSLLLLGRTRDGWVWHKQGVCIFLGGDQFFAVCKTSSCVCLFCDFEAGPFQVSLKENMCCHSVCHNSLESSEGRASFENIAKYEL